VKWLARANLLTMSAGDRLAAGALLLALLWLSLLWSLL
jgi:hypothetical protein